MQKLKTQGFTLIEIMIVLVIIAIMSAVVVLNVNASTYSGFMADGLKIASTLDIIADESVYTNSVIACDVNSDGFTCQCYRDGEWDDLDIKKLISWGWPSKIRITTVSINGKPLKDNEKIRFFPSGDILPMSFQISDGVHTAWIDGDMDGTFTLEN